MKLSILVPVYNERAVVERSLAQVLAAPLPENMERELVVVDDCSTDGTSAILERLAAAEPAIRLFRHAVNQGKGAAVRTAIEQAGGEFCIIQDADLEYDPSEYPRLLKPLLAGYADAVFGSRYLAAEQTRVLPFWHSRINKYLTLISNMFCNLNLTDMETCYKVFRSDLLKSIPIRSNRFGIEPEITMKCAKRKLRIYEVPISYHGRTHKEGKKIGWRDGVKALAVILKYWLIDDLYAEAYGRAYLNSLTGTPQYLNWMAELARPHVGDRVLELDGGVGTIAGELLGRRQRYVVTERDPLYLHALRNRFLRTPNVHVAEIDPAAAAQFAALGTFDTALCIGVLQSLEHPGATLAALHGALEPGGTLLVVVPQGSADANALDRAMGHRQRFRRGDLQALLAGAGFEVTALRDLNKIGAPLWWLYGGLLGREHISKLVLKLFNESVWLWRRIDPLLPWSGHSLVAVARKPR